jgi:mannitol/fructose-specific phosphotransferase system IIA component (Ntr-type)
MDIKEFLSPNDTLIDVRASDKTRFLRELARRAAASLNLAPERIVAEILKREELGSTGTGGGVAIPHARIQELATVARKLRDPTSLRDLRAAASTARLYAAMIA